MAFNKAFVQLALFCADDPNQTPATVYRADYAGGDVACDYSILSPENAELFAVNVQWTDGIQAAGLFILTMLQVLVSARSRRNKQNRQRRSNIQGKPLEGALPGNAATTEKVGGDGVNAEDAEEAEKEEKRERRLAMLKMLRFVVFCVVVWWHMFVYFGQVNDLNTKRGVTSRAFTRNSRQYLLYILFPFMRCFRPLMFELPTTAARFYEVASEQRGTASWSYTFFAMIGAGLPLLFLTLCAVVGGIPALVSYIFVLFPNAVGVLVVVAALGAVGAVVAGAALSAISDTMKENEGMMLVGPVVFKFVVVGFCCAVDGLTFFMTDDPIYMFNLTRFYNAITVKKLIPDVPGSLTLSTDVSGLSSSLGVLWVLTLVGPGYEVCVDLAVALWDNSRDAQAAVSGGSRKVQAAVADDEAKPSQVVELVADHA